MDRAQSTSSSGGPASAADDAVPPAPDDSKTHSHEKPPGACAGIDGRYRIAHISDLHFGRGWSEDNWTYVSQLLRRFRPHLLVVTGDIVDSPTLFTLAMVRNELDALVAELDKEDGGCELAIVPGNHDVGLWGNLYAWPWKGKFSLVFSKRRYRVFNKVGRWTDHHKAGPWRRAFRRLWWSCRFALRRASFSLWNAEPFANPLIGCTNRGGLILARFDSNNRAQLATGRIRAEELMSLDERLTKLNDTKRAIFGPRVALLHHHALAIPYSSQFESLTSFEPFLALRNSGDLLHALGSRDFDLVLHGHKHYWSFARVSFDAAGNSASEVAVVAAGSATLLKPESHWNGLNLFEVLPNGLINHRQHRFSVGVPANVAETLEERQGRWLSPVLSVKERIHRKAVKLLQSHCDVLERHVKLESDGAAQFWFNVRGLSVTGVENLDTFSFPFSVASGAISPASVEIVASPNEPGHRLNVDKRARPSKHIDISIGLAAPLHRNREPLNLSVTCRAINTFAISEWEAKLLPGIGSTDWIGVTIRHPTELLRLVVQLPEEFEDPAPVLRVMRPRHYPILDLDAARCEIKLNGDTQWEEDYEMTQLEADAVIPVAGQPNCFEVAVDKPIVGYRYKIVWRVQTGQGPVDLGAVGAAQQLRETLLAMAEAYAATDGGDMARRSKGKQVFEFGQQMFDELVEAVLYPEYKSTYRLDESFSAAFLVLDERDALRSDKPSALKPVYEKVIGPPVKGRASEIPLNEGVAGTAFKKRRLSGYAASELTNVDTKGAYVYYPGDLPPEPDRFAVLIAVPVYLTEEGRPRDVRPEEMIGVFTVGTNAKDSGLLRLIDVSESVDSADSANDASVNAGDILLAFALRFLSGLASAVQNGPPAEPSDEMPDEQH